MTELDQRVHVQRADASRKIRLERRTQPLERSRVFRPLADAGCPGAVTMDLTPFFDGPDHIEDIVRRCVAHGGSPVRIGEAGPGSLHTGHEVGLQYDVLTRSQVAEAAPELIFLHDNAASACLRMATGDDDLVPLPGERGINVNITGGEHVHEWHVGGPDLAYATSTGLQVPQPGDGIPVEEVTYLSPDGKWARAREYEERPPESLRDRYGLVRVLPDTPGAFVWHDGARKHATLVERGKTLVAPGWTPHGVNAVPPGFVRVTLIMSWVWREDLDRLDYALEDERELADYLYGAEGHSGELRATEV